MGVLWIVIGRRMIAEWGLLLTTSEDIWCGYRSRTGSSLINWYHLDLDVEGTIS
jgi:hypothetical protein